MPDELSDLTGVSETLLIPLVARYRETKSGRGILSDEESVRVLDSLGIDVSKIKQSPLDSVGACLRTIIIDDFVGRFIKDNPEGIIINCGCGLDTRFSRLDNGKIQWFDIDLSHVIKLRKKIFKETSRYRFITGDLLEPQWTESIPKTRKTLFVMEGLLIYFPEEAIKGLFLNIKDHFPGAELVIHVFSTLMVRMNKLMISRRRGLTQKAGSMIKWGIDSGLEIENWFPGIVLEKEINVVDRDRRRFPIAFRALWHLFPALTNMSKIIHLRMPEA